MVVVVLQTIPCPRKVAGGAVKGAGTGADIGRRTSCQGLEPASGCARGTKAGAGDTVGEMLNISSGTDHAPPTPPMGQCPKCVSSFGYITDFLLRKTVRSDNDSIRKL